MVQSKFIKLDINVLLEYVYDDSNLISENYLVLNNLQDSAYQYIAAPTSGTLNTEANSLFLLDAASNKYGVVDPTNYNFLQLQNYAAGQPIRHDKLIFHFPISYTFEQFIGMQVNVYAFDYNNQNTYDLSNYFFDKTDINTFNDMSLSAPPILFQEKLWGKYIEVDIPSVYALSLQRTNGLATPNSINYNLTNGVGLSLNSPIFINFRFLQGSQTINGVMTYIATTPYKISMPITPDFESLAVNINESTQGDFFEINGIYNGNIAEFNSFINNSFAAGKRYYVQYVVTLFEENIEGNSQTYTIIDNFDQVIEMRPIIKFSTTTAVIDVVMNIINQVDNSQITRRASYGMLVDQLSKYSLYLSSINVSGFNTPKVYNVKNIINGSGLGIGNGNGGGGIGNNIQIQQVRVPYPIMTDISNVVAKSDNVVIGKTIYYGVGNLQLLIMPFDNIINITIAASIENNKVTPFDLSSVASVALVFQNLQLSVSCDLYNDSGEVNLSHGFLIFKVSQSQIANVRTIFTSGINVFYITSTSTDGNTSVVYSGTYVMYDSQSNINSLNQQASTNQANLASGQPTIIDDSALPKETAIVTRVQTFNQQAVTTPATKTVTTPNTKTG